MVVVESAPAPLPVKSVPETIFPHPVPPLATASVPEIFASVEVAVHVGVPFTSARTVPLVVDAMRARDVAEFA